MQTFTKEDARAAKRVGRAAARYGGAGRKALIGGGIGAAVGGAAGLMLPPDAKNRSPFVAAGILAALGGGFGTLGGYMAGEAKGNRHLSDLRDESGNKFSPEELEASARYNRGMQQGMGIMYGPLGYAVSGSVAGPAAKVKAAAAEIRARLGGLVKAAAATPPAGYMGMTHQQYMPQYQRRVEFTPEEQELIRRNKGNVIPKIFTSQADSPAVDMASPVWSGVGGALGGAALGGVMAGTASPRAMGIGATAGGVLGAVVAAMARKAQNASIEENMRRLPPGAVRRDYEADPVYQAAQERDARIRAARLAAHAAGGAHKFASATEPGMDPLKATATGAGVGAALGGAVSFGDPGMMGRGALAGGSAGYLVSAVDRIVARRQQRQRMEKPARFGLNTYTPLDGTGAAGNIAASIANVIARIKGKTPALRWQAHQVSSEVPTLGGAAIGGLLGGLSRGRETRDVVEDAPDGRKIRRPVTTERTIGDRVGGAIAGAGIGAVAGNVAARGYVAGTPPEWAGWLTRK